MTLEAVIFGGIGSIAECADIDRAAWNAAFRAHDVPWTWSAETYAELMRAGGDRQLAARYRARTGEAALVDDLVLDATHQKIFASILTREIPLRPGVARVLQWSMRGGLKLGLVTRAEMGPVRALLQATARLRFGIEFDVAVLRGDVAHLAPDPEGMERAVAQLGVGRARVTVVADTPATAAAAQSAGLSVLAFPGLLSAPAPGDFGALPRVSVLSPEAITGSWCGAVPTAAQ
ncbi:HAD family hydrolase [Hasllibacter sp. MH4015]|uniref:HAD family hydrolase n=1 Tax=Hasllibacter sp. MH4015 TaxID=2854029 RepID=UPI001CD54629|nr:HAD family hydrolase [Hasllibacter sp. MH4015]